MITFNHRQIGNVTILDTDGHLTLGAGVRGLHEKMHELTAAGQINVLLNMAEVIYVDSSGLGALVGSFTTMAKLGGHLKLLSLTKRVQDLLRLTRLDTTFETFTDEAAAVASFGQADAAGH